MTLNVWVPVGAEAGLPVLVWVYGGAFLTGGSSFPLYNGARLAAEQQVVVASVNYRVGALGFMDLRQVPGGEATTANCGLHDVRSASQGGGQCVPLWRRPCDADRIR